MRFKKKIESEKDAIEQSLLMWKWLKDNPDEYKIDYLKLKTKNKPFIWTFNCACCERYCLNCNKCPLVRHSFCGKQATGSAYDNWLRDIDKAKNAEIIYNQLKKVYDKKFGEKKNEM
jgi:hypothetical protein